MAVTAAFDRAVPDADSAYFTNGERAITVASDVAAVPNGTYRLARYLNVTPGVYMIEVMFRPSGSLSIGGTTISGTGLVRTQIDIPQGNQRFDLTLTKSGAGDCYAAMLIFQADRIAYASAGEYWVWDTSPIADASIPSLPDPRLSMPVLGVLPNWRDGITERLTFLTSILSSETGMEQRRAIRQHPRRSFEMEFMRHTVLRSRMDNFIVGIGVKEFLLPLWHEQFKSVTGITANEVSQQFPNSFNDGVALREFGAGDAVLITTGDPNTHEVCIIDSVNAATGLVTWRSKPTKTWTAGTLIVPLRKSTVADKSSMTLHGDRVGTVRLRFNLSDPMVVPADWGYCVPLWRFPINRKDTISFDVDRMIYSIDNQSGPVRYSNPMDRAFVGTRAQVMFRGRAMLSEFRKFIAAARGRAQRFYAPSHTQAIVPTGDYIEPTFIEAHHAGFLDLMSSVQESRRILAIVFNDDSPTIYRHVETVTEGVGDDNAPVERFALTDPLPDRIKVDRVERIEWLMPTRFDQDSFEIKHLVDQSAVITSSLMFRSVDGTGMPDINCGLTSWAYPLTSVDGVDVGVSVLSGLLQSIPKPIEAMDVTLAPVSGTLIVPLVTRTQPAEAADVSLAPVSGTLFVPLITRTQPAEALDTTMSPVSGVLQSLLISYNNYRPEATDVNLSMVSGTLLNLEYTWDDLDVAWDGTEVAWDDFKE